MAEECDERSFWEILWDIFVAVIGFFLTVLLFGLAWKFLIAIAAEVLAAILGGTLAQILAMLLLLSGILWNMIRKGISVIWDIVVIIERQRTTSA